MGEGKGPMAGRNRGGQGQSTAATTAPEPDRLDMIDDTYRSVYLPQVRNETPRSLDVFDAADSNAIVGNRATSDTADQALYLLNNPFVLAQSQAFAARLEAETRSKADQVHKAFLLAYGRPPYPTERQAALALLTDLQGSKNPLTLLCQSLFASAEFRYIN